MNPLPELSKAEYEVIHVLWKHGQLSVREVHDRLSETNLWAYSTTKTVMDRMSKKKLLSRKNFHGIFVYSPLISRPAGMAKLVKFFADHVLELDYASVVSMFAQNKSMSTEELDELNALLDNHLPQKKRDK